MSAQMPTSPNVMQQWLRSLPFSKQLLVWGGAGLVVTGYGITHLPSPIELLSWTGVVGAGLWGVRRFWRSSKPLGQAVERSLSLEQVKRAIAQTKTQLEQLASESANGPSLLERYTRKLVEIEQNLSREKLELQIVGTRAVGKTTLRQLLEGQLLEPLQQRWTFAGLDGLCAEVVQIDGGEALKSTDVVLFVVQGDLTQVEWVTLQQLQAQHKRLLLLLNKQDRHLPAQAEFLLEQIKQRVQAIVASEDVMAIATSPAPLKVRQHQPDGTYQETWETPQPQIQPLLQRMKIVAAQEVKQLVLQRAYQQTLAVQTRIQDELNQIRRNRTLPLIERYQWIAAGAAFANPLTSLDMVATAAITGKMIQELAKTYQIQLSLDRATEIAGVLAKTLVQMGLVEVSSQLLSTVLKGNAATYIVGGTLQGVGAAYFTRMAALSLIELFEVHQVSKAGWQLDRVALGQIVQRVFSQHQRLDVFRDLVQETMLRFKPKEEAAIASF
jgi:uncharacterized protein